MFFKSLQKQIVLGRKLTSIHLKNEECEKKGEEEDNKVYIYQVTQRPSMKKT